MIYTMQKPNTNS